MNSITVQYGTETYIHSFASSIRVGEVLSNATVKAVLGYGDNVKGLVNGVEQPSDAILSNGTTLVVETKANSKAVRS